MNRYFYILFLLLTFILKINSQSDFKVNAYRDSLLEIKSNKNQIVKVLLDSLIKTTETIYAYPILDILLEFQDDDIIRKLLYNIELQTSIEAICCDYPIKMKLHEKVDKIKILSIVFNTDFLDEFVVRTQHPTWLGSKSNLDLLANYINSDYKIVNYEYIYNKTKDNTNKKMNLELLIKKIESKYK